MQKWDGQVWWRSYVARRLQTKKSDVFVCQAFVINEFVKTEAVYRLSLSVTLHLGLYSSFSMHLPEGQIYRPTKKFELLTIFFFGGGGFKAHICVHNNGEIWREGEDLGLPRRRQNT